MSDTPPTLQNGRYRIDQVLGVGGMSVVLLAYDTRMGVHRAIKLLNRRFANNSQVRERFEIEASAQARLRHPNVLMVHDVIDDDAGVYMVMELAEGGSLAERVKTRGPLSPRETAEIGIKLASALGAAHAAGVIHRDIKPENVLIDRNGDLKLADFGIARVVTHDQGLTRTGMVMGTWAYMPPEQRESARQVDVRSDIYALGGCLYFLVTGRQPPALHNAESHAQAFEDVPPALADVIARATRFEPEHRFQTCTELRDALAAIAPSLGDEVVADFEPPTEPPSTLAPAAGDLSTYVQEHPDLADTLAPFLSLPDVGSGDTAVPASSDMDLDPGATYLPETGSHTGRQDGQAPAARPEGTDAAQVAARPGNGRRLAYLLLGAPLVVGVAVVVLLKLVQPGGPLPEPAGSGSGTPGSLVTASSADEPPAERVTATPTGEGAAPSSAGRVDGGASLPGAEHAPDTPAVAAAVEPSTTETAAGTASRHEEAPPAAPKTGDDGRGASTADRSGPATTSPASGASSARPDGPRIITVIPSTDGSTGAGAGGDAAGGDDAAPSAASTGATSDPTGLVVVRTVPSGATVLEGGQVLQRSGRGYRLPVGSHVLEIRSPSGEQTRRAVHVDKDATVEICYSFDTNSACSDAQTSD